MTDPARPAFHPPPVPRGWEAPGEAVPTALWVAVEPAGASPADRFRSNLVLTCDDVAGMGFRDWQAGTDQLLPRALADYLLIDLERIEIDGLPGGRRLAHHVDDDGRALTMEQWFALDGDRGWTLTATVETWRYDELADVCARAAARWRPRSGRGTDAG